MPLTGNVSWIAIIGLYIHIAGFVIGLGAVTVIDLQGFLGRKSPYWTEATTRTHKVTKPLIWLGLLLAIIGAIIFHYNQGWSPMLIAQAIIAGALVTNGIFLSFKVSPFFNPARERRQGSGASATYMAEKNHYCVPNFFCWLVERAIFISLPSNDLSMKLEQTNTGEIITRIASITQQ